MHPSSAFKAGDLEAREIVAAHPFAVLAVNGEEGPIAALTPLLWRDDGKTLFGHVSRANAIVSVMKPSPVHAIAIFQGGDGYVSPSWYSSKRQHGRVVPTWNYVAVEARGQLRVDETGDAVADYVGPLSDAMEHDREIPWQVDDAPDDYITKLAAGIVCFEIEVGALKAVRKLSQNKSAEDRSGVSSGLRKSADPRLLALANEMDRETSAE